jgi:hypothetical protein
MRGGIMIRIELRPEIEAQLTAEAQARGLALEQYVAEKLSASQPAAQKDVAAAIDSIRQLRKGNTLGGLSITDLIHEGQRI